MPDDGPTGVRHEGGVTVILASMRNVRTCRSDVKGAGQAGSPCKTLSTKAEHRGGVARSSEEGSVMGLERRGGLVRWDCDGQPVTGRNRRDLTTGSRVCPGPACCTEEEEAREPPSPAADHATRTELGRPRSSIRLSTWAAIATSVARASSLWKRSPLPMTCFQRANWPSTPAL
jgi:hypothetical protein